MARTRRAATPKKTKQTLENVRPIEFAMPRLYRIDAVIRIADGMKSRWRWEPVEYDKLGPRLKHIVDYLLDAPTLGEESEVHRTVAVSF